MPLVAITIFLSDMSIVGGITGGIYVAEKVDAGYGKLDIGEIGGIMAQTPERLYAVVAAHVPYYLVAVLKQQFGKGGRP